MAALKNEKGGITTFSELEDYVRKFAKEKTKSKIMAYLKTLKEHLDGREPDDTLKVAADQLYNAFPGDKQGKVKRYLKELVFEETKKTETSQRKKEAESREKNKSRMTSQSPVPYSLVALEEEVKDMTPYSIQTLFAALKTCLKNGKDNEVKTKAKELQEEIDRLGSKSLSEDGKAFLKTLHVYGSLQEDIKVDPATGKTTVQVGKGPPFDEKAKIHHRSTGKDQKDQEKIDEIFNHGGSMQSADNQKLKSTKDHRAPEPNAQKQFSTTMPPQSVSSVQQVSEVKETDSSQEILLCLKQCLSSEGCGQPEGMKSLQKHSLGLEIVQGVNRLKEENKKMAEANDNNIMALKDQLKAAESECDKLRKEKEKEKEDADNKIKGMQQTMGEIEKNYNDYCNQHDNVISEKNKVISDKETAIREKEENLKQLDSILKNEQKTNAKLQEMHIKAKQESEGWKNQFQDMAEEKERQQRKFSEDISQLHRENKQLKSRVSELAGAKLMDNNPDIADLSDPNRALKLGEKFSGLYDDDWTDAYQIYTDTFKMTEQQAIEQLLKILMKTYEFCRKVADEQMDCLCNVFENPCQDIPKALTMKPQKDKTSMTQKHRKDLKDLRKQIALKKADNITKQYLNKEYEEVKKGDKKQKSMLDETKVYYEKCVEVCWPMVLHDPPVKMDPAIHPGVKIDPNRFRLYGGNGDTLEYIVWPPLLVEGGGLLAKGVAKPKKEPRVVKKP